VKTGILYGAEIAQVEIVACNQEASRIIIFWRQVSIEI
jgi:hypothetical protein